MCVEYIGRQTQVLLLSKTPGRRQYELNLPFDGACFRLLSAQNTPHPPTTTTTPTLSPTHAQNHNPFRYFAPTYTIHPHTPHPPHRVEPLGVPTSPSVFSTYYLLLTIYYFFPATPFPSKSQPPPTFGNSPSNSRNAGAYPPSAACSNKTSARASSRSTPIPAR